MKQQITEEDLSSDKLGILVSALCCLHCMALPGIMIFAPSLSRYFEHEVIHVITFLTVVPVGLYAFISKLKIHENKKPLYTGIFGIMMLASSMLLHEAMPAHTSELLEIVFSVIGGVSLIVAHITNIRLCRCKTCEH